MTTRAKSLAALLLSIPVSICLISVQDARAFEGPEVPALRESSLFGRYQGALGVLKGRDDREPEWKPVAAGPVMDAPPVASAQAGPCRENASLDSTSFFLMLTPPDKRRPFTSTFAFESCVEYDSDRDGRPGMGQPQAIRTYKGNKGYDLLLITPQGRGSVATHIYLIRRLDDGGREVAGSMGQAPTADLPTTPVRPDVPSVRVFSNGQSLEGKPELMPKRPK